MTGLEMLLNHIQEEALENKNRVIVEATKRAEEIMTSAIIDGKKQYDKIITTGKEEASLYLKRADSAAFLQKKKLILQAKQDILAKIWLSAKETLVGLTRDQYFEIILKMLPHYALSEKGEIAFSAKDLSCIPQGFEELINQTIEPINGGTLKIASKARDIEGGFILTYDAIEENCSFEALLMENKENLQDKICDILFKGQ